MNRATLRSSLKLQIKGLSTKFELEEYNEAISQAERDTGWTLPVTSSFQQKWMIERAKRHLFSFLLAESAHKFKFEGINLHNRYTHYKGLVKQADIDFEKAIEENAHEFAGVPANRLFGTKIDAGFSYEPQTGRDTTYGEDNQVIFEPNENS